MRKSKQSKHSKNKKTDFEIQAMKIANMPNDYTPVKIDIKINRRSEIINNIGQNKKVESKTRVKQSKTILNTMVSNEHITKLPLHSQTPYLKHNLIDHEIFEESPGHTSPNLDEKSTSRERRKFNVGSSRMFKASNSLDDMSINLDGNSSGTKSLKMVIHPNVDISIVKYQESSNI